MRLELDPTKCAGFGVCAQLLPELIDLGSWGFPILGRAGHRNLAPENSGFEADRRSVEVPPELTTLAHRTVYNCPKLALMLSE